MKKLAFLLLTVSFIFNSCSSSSPEEQIPEIPKLVIKIETTDTNSTITDVSNFEYDSNNFLTKVSFENNDYTEFIYDGDKVIRINKIHNNNVYVVEQLEYLNNKLSKYSHTENGVLGYEIEYTYDSNSFLISDKVTDFHTSGNNTIEITDFTYDTTNNTVTGKERGNPQHYSILTYDDKKVPFSEMQFFQYMRAYFFTLNINHNFLERKTYNNGYLINTRTHTNEYDNDDFLIKDTFIDDNNVIATTTYTYNK